MTMITNSSSVPLSDYSTAAQQLAAGVAVENFLTGTAGKVIQSLSKIMR
jgi:hypothetical protein